MRSQVVAFAAAGLVSGLLFPWPGGLLAQSLSFGVKGGVPFTDAVEGSFGNRSGARRYTVGPMVEVGLPFSVAVEFNALYKRTGYSTSDNFFSITSITQVRANSWEFPLLLKYYLRGHGLPVRPYVEGGYVVRHLSGVEGIFRSFGRDIVTGAPFDTSSPLNTSFLVRDDPTHGLAVGGGLRFRAGPLRLAPEIRYTRWTGTAFSEQGARGFFVQSLQNQAEFLIGLSF
jgi:hypothetical protein